MMRAEPSHDQDQGSVITDQGAETLERPTPAVRSPAMASPITVHSQMVMQELADREAVPESRSRGGDDNAAI